MQQRLLCRSPSLGTELPSVALSTLWPYYRIMIKNAMTASASINEQLADLSGPEIRNIWSPLLVDIVDCFDNESDFLRAMEWQEQRSWEYMTGLS